MGKHAFLIIAHNEFDILQKLILALDNERIDIFVHIDKKVKTLPVLHSIKSRLFILENRVDTRWGDVSQIKTEYVLFKAAFEKTEYDFYHVISGVHLPLKPIEELLAFYDNHIGSSLFYNFSEGNSYQNILKIRRYNFFTRGYAFGPKWRQKYCQISWRLAMSIQEKFKITHNTSIKLYQSANWVSLSPKAMAYMIGKEKYVYKIFRYSFCGDEYFVPTVLMGSELFNSVVRNDKLLFQRMGAANAATLSMADFDEMMSSGCLFARKISQSQPELVNMIMKIHES